MIKRLSDNYVIIQSADEQWTATVANKGFRRWQVTFLHDSSDTPLNVKYCHDREIAVYHGKNFVENPE